MTIMELKLTRRQCYVFVSIAITHFFSGMVMSIPAPFYPAVATSKGVSATVFGCVFGIFQLVVFILSPFYGKYIGVFGTKLMMVTGIYSTAMSCVLFGFLDNLENKVAFTAFSFLFRILQASGDAAYLTASFTISTKELANHLPTLVAFIEIFYGVGLAIGPSIGGVLYEAGGFITPFATVGFLLLLSGTMCAVLVPESEAPDFSSEYTVMDLLHKPKMLLSLFAIACVTANIGFIDVTLEPHLRQFHLSPIYIGLIFFLGGVSYTVTAPFWGRIGDCGLGHSVMIIIGTMIIFTAFLLIGPLPFVPLESSITLITVAVALNKIGIGATAIASFASAQVDAVELGLPDDLGTLSLVSRLWTSAFSLGGFIGCCSAGALLDAYGFRYASIFIFTLNCLLIFLHLASVFYYGEQSTRNRPIDQEPLQENQNSSAVAHLEKPSFYGALK